MYAFSSEIDRIKERNERIKDKPHSSKEEVPIFYYIVLLVCVIGLIVSPVEIWIDSGLLTATNIVSLILLILY